MGSDLLIFYIYFFKAVTETDVISQDYLIYFSEICQVAGSFYAALNNKIPSPLNTTEQSNSQPSTFICPSVPAAAQPITQSHNQKFKLHTDGKRQNVLE